MIKDRHKRYREANREKLNINRKKYYREHKAEINRKQLEYNQASFKNYLLVNFIHIRAKDKKKGYNFDIDLEYILKILEKQHYRCAITGIKMTHKHNDIRAVSIDRIDSLKGHVKGNIQLVCQGYNYLKRDCTDFEAIGFLADVVKVAVGSNKSKIIVG